MDTTFIELNNPEMPDKKKGRPLGALGKRPQAIKDILNSTHLHEAMVTGEIMTPVEFLLEVMIDDEYDLDVRMEAAGKLLPYLHRKQPQVIEQTTMDITPSFQISFIKPEETTDV